MRKTQTKSGPGLLTYFQRVAEELGATNSQRLLQFIDIEPEADERYQFAKVFETLFKGQTKSNAQESFKKFRKAVNDAAREIKCSLRMLIDKSRSADLAKRYCWFEVDPSDNPELNEFADRASRQADFAAGDQRSRAIASRPTYEIFISYSSKNKTLAVALLDELNPRLKLMTEGKPYDIKFWMDRKAIEPGNQWRNEIDAALQRTPLGLLLLSVDFLSSDFISKVERPFLLDIVNNKLAVPVMLRDFPLDNYRTALGEIWERQIFRYHHTNGNEYGWNQCRGEVLKDLFADELAKRLVLQLDQIYKQSSSPDYSIQSSELSDYGKVTRETGPAFQLDLVASQQANSGPIASGLVEATDYESLDKELRDEKTDYAHQAALHDPNFDRNRYEKNRGRAGSLHDTNAIDKRDVGHEVIAVDYLMDWATAPASIHSEFLAVLGEFGIGKTTTLHQFAQDLIARRKKELSLPLPLLFDLRAYTPGPEITLDLIMKACVGSVKTADGERFKLDVGRLIHSVRNEGAIAIFDGLDEVMNGLTPKQRQTFAAELWSILPPLPETHQGGAREGETPKHPAGRGRIIMSCRSHFFRDVFEQNGIYTGHERAGLSEDDRRMLLILPFNESQVQSYLKCCLGEEQGEKIFALLQQIHNLIDLAKRPVLANMIREIIPDLERMMLSGERVLGVDLYDRFIRKHLERDEGKHVFSKAHKLRMMESLAADMWISGARDWSWEQMEQWLDEFLAQNPSIAGRYHQPAEVLNQDFRNATAVVRQAEEKSDFRFAHTSLQEYFLARWMQRSLEEGPIDRFCKLPMPSDETLEFFGQLLSKARDMSAIQKLETLMQSSEGQASLIGFRYLLIANEKGYPLPKPASISLAGACLYRWRIKNLQLQNVDLSRAHLSETQWSNVAINGGSLVGAKATQSQWRDCQLTDVETKDVVTDGATFRDCTFGENSSLNGWHAGCRGVENTTAEIPAALLAQIPDGHSGSVNCVSYDRDHGRYISGSHDKTLKVWDAQSHQCLATLRGHLESVRSVMYDSDRGRYISGSDDQALKVWDAQSLECLATLSGHLRSVLSAIYDSDRGLYISGSHDNTLKVWDAESFQCLATLHGHSDSVWSVIYDGDRGRYISGSSDKTLKIWNTQSHQCLATLSGHSESVRSVIYDRDRGQYISGSDDNTLKVWDAQRHQCLATLSGHAGSVRSAIYDGDRGRYISGSNDSTLKVWDAQSHQCVATRSKHFGPVWSVIYDGDRGRFISGSSDKTLRVWDAQRHQCLATLREQTTRIRSVIYDSDRGRYISGSSDKSLRVWDAHSHQCLATLSGHTGSVWSLIYDRVRGRFISGSDTLKVWDAQSFQCLATLRGHSGPVLAVNGDIVHGRFVSGSSDNTLKVWDAQSHQCLATLRGHSGPVASVIYDCDRGRYISGSDDESLIVWDGQRHQCLATLSGHTGFVLSVMYDSDRGRYISGSSDNTLKVWDAQSQQCLATLSGHSGTVYCVMYDSDRGRYISGSHDNTLKVWDAQSLQCLATYMLLPDGQWATIEGSRHVQLSPNAAEHLKWVGREAKTGQLIAIPYEGLL